MTNLIKIIVIASTAAFAAVPFLFAETGKNHWVWVDESRVLSEDQERFVYLVLKKNAETSQEDVYVKDVAECHSSSQVCQKIQFIRLLSAPKPGHSASVYKQHIATILEQELPDHYIKIDGANFIRVKTTDQTLHGEQLAEQFRSYLSESLDQIAHIRLEHLKITPLQTIKIRREGYQIDFSHIIDLKKLKTTKDVIRHLSGSRHKNIRIVMENDSEETFKVLCSIQFSTLIPTAKHNIEARKSIQPEFVELSWQPVTSLSRYQIFDAAQIYGQKSRVPILAGQAIRKDQIVREKLVKRNERLTLAIKTPALEVRVPVRALNDGHADDNIVVEAIKTKKKYTVVVTGPQKISLQM